jgi:enoyl-CoA hydratase/carnithine racemase
MSFIQVSDDSDVRIITLARPKANVLNLAMVEELLSAVHAAREDSQVRAVVVASNQPGFFSTGFDVVEVFDYDRNAMRHFFRRFLDLFNETLHMPKAVIGGIRGHAYAGGAFLAVAFDQRVFAEGSTGFALNEINFGAVLPSIIRHALINIVGAHQAARIILSGEKVSPAEAHKIGLADVLVQEDQVLPASVALAHQFAAKPPSAFAISKQALQSDFALSGPSESLDLFIDQWFSPECSELRQALTQSLKSKSSPK